MAAYLDRRSPQPVEAVSICKRSCILDPRDYPESLVSTGGGSDPSYELASQTQGNPNHRRKLVANIAKKYLESQKAMV